jgi:hypothetical protein
VLRSSAAATLACARQMAARRHCALRSSAAATLACARQMAVGRRCALRSSAAATPACARQMVAGLRCALRSSAAATLVCARQMAAWQRCVRCDESGPCVAAVLVDWFVSLPSLGQMWRRAKLIIDRSFSSTPECPQKQAAVHMSQQRWFGCCHDSLAVGIDWVVSFPSLGQM